MEKNSNINPRLCAIYFTSINDVASVITSADNLHKTVTFKPGKAWEEIYAAPATKEFNEDQKEHNAGPYWDQKVFLFFPGDDEQSRSDFDNYGNKRMLIKLVFRSGIYKLLGDLTNPVKAFHKFDVKGGGHDVTFACQAIQQAFLLN